MKKLIRGEFNEIIKAIMNELLQKVSMFNYDEFKLHIESALLKFNYDLKGTCDCHELDRHGETFCCNHCGRPVTNQNYTDKTHWIAVTDRLPDCHSQHKNNFGSGYLIVYTKYDECKISQFWDNSQWEHEDVTHWMQIPNNPNNKTL
jgi:hypothetical protein